MTVMTDGVHHAPPSPRSGQQEKPRRGRRRILRSFGAMRGVRKACTVLSIAAVLVLLPAYLLLPHTATWPGSGPQSMLLTRRSGRRAFGASSGGSDGGGDDFDVAELGGAECAPGCEAHGTCDRDLGVCRCPFGWGGADCSQLALPACRLAADAAHDKDRPIHCGMVDIRMMPWRPSCECHRQCHAHIKELGDDATLLNWERARLENPAEALCFERPGLPPEQQISAFPGENEPASYFRGALNGSQVAASREEVAAHGAHEVVVPLSACPNSCSYEGGCVQAKSGQHKPFCSCLATLQGSDCSEPEFRGRLFDRCVNACSGVGACVGGFCRCPAGRWGIDCSRTQAWPPHERRPSQGLKIYIYELPFALNHIMSAPFSNNCSTVQVQPARRGPGNGIYRAYWAFFQMLLADLGGARTENPYEANLFFIPSQTYPTTDNLGSQRPHNLRAVDWVRSRFPFWNASGGADHALWWSSDQGAGFSHYANLPRGHTMEHYELLERPIKVTHFCYTGPGAGSSTNNSHARYGLDGDYEWAPGFVFDPTRDICAAPYANFDIQGQATDTYSSMQDTPRNRADKTLLPLGRRRTLMYFLGRASGVEFTRDPQYSGGARQSLFRHHANSTGFRISHGNELDPPLLGNEPETGNSTFCFAPTGHGFGMRLVNAMALGCIPVIVQDDVHQFFDDVLPYHQFSLRVAQSDIPRLDAILASVPDWEVAHLQWGMVDWHRAFIWDQPSGLAYNYTLASLRRVLANPRAQGELLPLPAAELTTPEAVSAASEQ